MKLVQPSMCVRKDIRSSFHQCAGLVRAGSQDGKDAEEKEAKRYKNVYDCLTKGWYPQGASNADKSVLYSKDVEEFPSCRWNPPIFRGDTKYPVTLHTGIRWGQGPE